MISRRNFTKAATLGAGSALANGAQAAMSERAIQSADWFMPDEGHPHQRTWMAFGASEKIWGKKILPEVQRNLAAVAKAIAKYEPVSMLVRQSDYALAKKLLGASAVELIVHPIDDLWMRDTGPIFVINEAGSRAAIDFNFNGWGDKQEHRLDAEVAGFITERARVKALTSQLVLEGGGLEVDGQGAAIITESCVLNANRNPSVSKAACEEQLMTLLGLEKIIWLPGIKGKDITDGHTDFYARFASPGVVVAGYDPDPKSFDHAVTKKHLELLKTATDADGKRLQVVVLEAPKTTRPAFQSEEFAAGYINFYVCNGAVIMPEFGDARADGLAKEKLQSLFPGRKIEPLNIDGIAAGGGGIHCATQQEPKA